LEKDGNYLRDNTFDVEGRAGDVEFTTDVANNALVFSCNKIKAQFNSSHFRYKVAPLMVAKGHVEVDMNQIDMGFGIKMKLKQLDDGRFVPNLESVDVVADINRSDLKIHMFGNLLTDIGSLFEIFFKGTVCNLIEETITETLQTIFPEAVNAVIDYTDGFLPIPFVENWVFDWETPASAVVTETSFEIGLKALFFDKQLGEQDPGVYVPDMPYKDETKTA